MVVQQSEMISLGAPAPDFSLPATDNKTYSLDDFKDAPVLVVVFTCNHCPYAKASWPVLIDLAKQYRAHGVQFVAINANDVESYPEDSFEGMQKEVTKRNIPFPYLHDASQSVAKAYGAVCTPDPFVFDQERKLAYRGRINDNWQHPDAVTSHDLRDAIEALRAGDQPSADQKPSMGCSIKWK